MTKPAATLHNQSLAPESPWADLIARIWALISDILIMIIFANLLGLIWTEQLVRLGHWGVLLGYTIVLGYWGIMNSRLFTGQSLGKRLSNLRVVGADGQTISLGRSLVRSSVLVLPFMLSGIKLPPAYLLSPLGHPTKFMIITISYSIILGLIYFFLCNRPTRQSLPDLICGSYVVSTKHQGRLNPPPGQKIKYSWYILGLLLIILLSAIATLTPNPEFSREYRLQQQLDQIPTVFRSQVTRGRYLDSKANSFLRAELWVARPLVSEKACQPIVRRMVRLALDHYPDLSPQDNLEILIYYGYNIGLARNYQPYNQPDTVAGWRRRL